ncbi:hypothetical protein HC928_11245 [bacterium]|nr:hypothetical protein [bacterium]
MADLTFEKIVELVDRLTPQEQAQLTAHLLETARKRQLSVQEKMKLLRAAQIDVAVVEEPSVRREDWYGEDGR